MGVLLNLPGPQSSHLYKGSCSACLMGLVTGWREITVIVSSSSWLMFTATPATPFTYRNSLYPGSHPRTLLLSLAYR